MRPDGYVCADQVRVQPGYLSSPPAQERANGWQRMRYGVVRADSAVLAQPGDRGAATVREAGYLRGVLRRGDGITIVRERDEHVQIWSRHWLRRTDVTVSMPSPLSPINIQALPIGQRMMLAWVVPPRRDRQSSVSTWRNSVGDAAALRADLLQRDSPRSERPSRGGASHRAPERRCPRPAGQQARGPGRGL